MKLATVTEAMLVQEVHGTVRLTAVAKPKRWREASREDLLLPSPELRFCGCSRHRIGRPVSSLPQLPSFELPPPLGPLGALARRPPRPRCPPPPPSYPLPPQPRRSHLPVPRLPSPPSPRCPNSDPARPFLWARTSKNFGGIGGRRWPRSGRRACGSSADTRALGPPRRRR